ncbi:hypothetical protein OPV22_017918 [Ensete ventricosum]|uniref:Uncharacterized protein n=1 Tax=Ensete ventricosum TaxID=4639 RepID=A0AAV8R3B4_ENSVE|nr:hypothetical protein OPV22_017918 [Ensete ventricosum]
MGEGDLQRMGTRTLSAPPTCVAGSTPIGLRHDKPCCNAWIPADSNCCIFICSLVRICKSPNPFTCDSYVCMKNVAISFLALVGEVQSEDCSWFRIPSICRNRLPGLTLCHGLFCTSTPNLTPTLISVLEICWTFYRSPVVKQGWTSLV